jgi:4a-hydroxytetrahydrobiopterin dehydratase
MRDMKLSSKKCIPCEGDLQRLSAAETRDMIKTHTPGWGLKKEGIKLFREFKFKNFKLAQNFVNKVGDIAEAEGHHPDIEFGWGYAKITIFTHAIGGLHENDFILASKIDSILK